MDNRDTLRNLLIAGAVFVIVLAVGPKLFPPPPPQPGTDQMRDRGAAPTDGGSILRGPSDTTLPVDARTGPDSSAGGEPAGVDSGSGFAVVEAEAEETRAMGSAGDAGTDKKAPPSPYRMRLIVSNVGASIASATMTDHAQDLGSDARYQLLSTAEGGGGVPYRSLAIEKINIDEVDLILHDKKWHAGDVEETETGQTVDFWIEIHRGGAPGLKLTRTFTLPRQNRELGRHDLRADLIVENLSPQPHQVVVAYRGGLGVPRAAARMDDRYVDWGIHDGTRVVGQREYQHKVTKNAGETIRLYAPLRAEPSARLSWAATANTYFTCTIAPRGSDGQDNPTYLAKVSGVDLDGSGFTDNDVTLRFVTIAQVVDSDRVLKYPADVYLGEKDGDAFRDIEEYSLRNYYYQISQGFGWCTFNWLVELMIWLLNSLSFLTRDYGLAIIILVLIVRTLLHPITKKGQVNMVRMQQRMQEMAPKIEEIKKKYANDKARLNQEMMKLNINPAGQLVTCLPMMLQMPIWIALFLSLSNNIQMRHQPFHFTWIEDLTAADALVTFSSPIIVPLFGWALPSFNLLPILVSVFMYTQQKLQPKPKPNPNMTDQQRQQQEMMQKMMPMMSIMMLVFFYKMPSGLNLYIMFSSLFGTIEQYLIRKHIKQHEAAGTLHEPTRKDKEAIRPHKKPGRLSFFERLQKMADEAQKTQARRPTKQKSRR